MERFHHVIVFFISEQEKAGFLDAGIQFTVTRGSRGECIHFDIGEGDSRWENVTALIASLEGNDRAPKKYRVQDLPMTVPTMKENIRRMKERVAARKESPPGRGWLDGYSGQSADELLALEGEYRTDSLLLAFEEAIGQKAEHEGMSSLTDEERIVLAIEALEREVNSGGYDQFFANSSKKFAPMLVDALRRIGCKKTANITQRAIKAIGVSDLAEEAINAALAADDEQRRAKLSRCDDSYHKSGEAIEERLFAFIKANKTRIRF